MSDNKPRKPEKWMEGMVPTMNQRGFMVEDMDAYSQRFVELAVASGGSNLDMGCAYGVATRPVLEQGGRVTACDMEQGHLDVLAAETPAEQSERLTTIVGELPGVDFEPESFDTILCSRVLHFLKGADISVSVSKMASWLKTGGHLVLVGDSPYTGFWSASAPEYERRKAEGDPWPGWIADVTELLPSGQLPDGMLPYLNPLDPDILIRECEAAGLEVLSAGFTGRDTKDTKGNQHAGIVAQRPG